MGIPAGHFDFEAIRKALDEQGLDSPGKSLRDAAKREQAIDRDLPEGTGIHDEINWSTGLPTDDHIADALRHKDKIYEQIKRSMGMNQRFIMDPRQHGKTQTATDAFKKAYGGVVTGRSTGCHQTNAELQQEYFDAKARGDTSTQDYIRAKLARRLQKGEA